MHIIAGLGNPGVEHEGQRHNVGFMILDELARYYQLGNFRPRSKFMGDIVEGMVGQKRVIALKPTTFMNNSGKSIQSALNFYKLETQNLIIIHDELDLPIGRIKTKFSGGSAGHNGLKSITKHIGEKYWRIRIGIGKPHNNKNVENYVLSKFSIDESKWLKVASPTIAKAIPELLGDKPEHFGQQISKLQDTCNTLEKNNTQ
tara:strand:+ start:26837 stop:27442 length:606 start_codon:yes stop_codon:yes gene_type:complete